MHINGFTCDFWKLVERNFAMQESKRMLVEFLFSCIANLCYPGVQVACRFVSGFGSSKTSLCWNPCACSSHLWVPVLRNFALQESRSTTTGYSDSCTAKLRYRGIQKRDGNPHAHTWQHFMKKNERLHPFHHMDLHMNWPLSCSSHA